MGMEAKHLVELPSAKQLITSILSVRIHITLLRRFLCEASAGGVFFPFCKYVDTDYILPLLRQDTWFVSGSSKVKSQNVADSTTVARAEHGCRQH